MEGRARRARGSKAPARLRTQPPIFNAKKPDFRGASGGRWRVRQDRPCPRPSESLLGGEALFAGLGLRSSLSRDKMHRSG